MTARMDYGYSGRVFMGLLLTIGPGFAGWFGSDTLDAYPRYLLLVSGIAASAVLLVRRLRRRAVRETAARRDSKLLADAYPDAKAPFQMLFTILGPPCWFLALGLLGNQILDKAPPDVHHVRFVSYHKAPKSSAVVTVSSWRSSHETETLRYDNLKFLNVGGDTPGGAPVDVYVKPGFFGWPWVGAVRRSKF